MAFSLEAAMVMPCIISCSLGLILTAPEIYQEIWRAASLEVTAALQAVNGSSLYQAEIISEGKDWTTNLQSSPQMMFELVSLCLDDGRLLLRYWSDTGVETDSGQAAP